MGTPFVDAEKEWEGGRTCGEGQWAGKGKECVIGGDVAECDGTPTAAGELSYAHYTEIDGAAIRLKPVQEIIQRISGSHNC